MTSIGFTPFFDLQRHVSTVSETAEGAATDVETPKRYTSKSVGRPYHLAVDSGHRNGSSLTNSCQTAIIRALTKNGGTGNWRAGTISHTIWRFLSIDYTHLSPQAT